MSEIGEIFKEKREEIGITVEEASFDLKIDSVLLDNLEDGNDKVFKDILEVQDVIKAYAKYLGLDPEEILENYQEYLFNKTSKISLEDIKEGIEKTKKIEKLENNNENKEQKIKSPYTINNSGDEKDKNIIIALCIILLFVLVIMYFIIKNYILR